MTTHLPPKAPAAPKNWHQIYITAPNSLADILGSFLYDITGQGIELSENSKTITAYLPESPDAGEKIQQIKQFLSRLQESLPNEQKLTISLRSLLDEDWNRKWKAHFKPEHITPRLVIKPTWENYTPATDEKIIEMDPGMAFGTGHHASTRLCVQFIDRLLRRSTPPKTILDVGTGTGILAMTAVLLGANSTLAIDNDPEAVTVAAENIRRNNLSAQITTGGTDLQDVPGRFELVIANIIHDTLLAIAPLLIAKMEKGGHLILAGILAGEQEKGIAKAYTGLGIRHLATRQEGEWVSLLFINHLNP